MSSSENEKPAGHREEGAMSRIGESVITTASNDLHVRGSGNPGEQGAGRSREDSGVLFLKQEMAVCNELVNNLDKAVSSASAYREKANETLQEANRALSRLQQAMDREDTNCLVTFATEIKVGIRNSLHLVSRYGSKSGLEKVVANVLKRKEIHTKFEDVTNRLMTILPSATVETLPGGRPLQRHATGSRNLDTKSIGYPAGGGGTSMGILLREDHHGYRTKIYSIAYVPPVALSFDNVCLWWSAGQVLEHYSSGSTTAFDFKDPALTVTCLAVDRAGNVWTGLVKGLLRVRKRKHWDLVIENQGPAASISAIVFEEHGRAWIGDEAGNVRVLDFYEEKCQLVEVTVLTYQPSIEDRPSDKTTSTSKAWYKSGAASTSATIKRAQGPVRCIFVSGDRAWVGGGGRTEGWLTLWSALTFTQLDIWDAPDFGAINAICPNQWGMLGMTPALSKSRLAQAGEHDRWPLRTGNGDESWRLMTAHENGQVLLWHPGNDRLQPLIRVGGEGHSIRGLMVFEDFNLVVLAQSNGELALTVFHGLEPPGSDSVSANSFGVFRPRKVLIRAHNSNCSMMVGRGNTCVTTSTYGTVRLWHAKDLAAEGRRQGLLMDHAVDRADSQRISGGRVCFRRSFSQDHVVSFRDPAVTVARAEEALRIAKQSSDTISEHLVTDRVSAINPPTAMSSPMSHASEAESPSAGTVVADSHGYGFSVQQIESTELTLEKKIGAGAYGTVWLADWTDCQVAVKELILFGDGGNPDDRARAWQEMQNEVHLLGAFSHPNIMRFLAVCVDPPMIVMQYYPHGSLFDLLTKARKGNARAIRDLSWAKRLSMLRDVAAGMHYLHTRKPSVIHGDLRSPNLLLDLTIDKNVQRYHVKIADFGLARKLNQTGNEVKVSKTTNPRWLAPEVIQSGQIGPAADVYSFAIIMWEMMTWAQPYEDMMSVQVIYISSIGYSRPEVPDDAGLPGNPGVSLAMYKDVMQRCWCASAEGRPNFKTVVKLFDEMRDMESAVAAEEKQVKMSKSAAPVIIGPGKGDKKSAAPGAASNSAGLPSVDEAAASPRVMSEAATAPCRMMTAAAGAGAGAVTAAGAGAGAAVGAVAVAAAAVALAAAGTGSRTGIGKAVAVDAEASCVSRPYQEGGQDSSEAAAGPFSNVDGNDPFGAAAGSPFENNAESSPFGAAAGSPFGSSAQPDPFGAAAGTPFDNNAESNPFGDAAGSPFDNGVELGPFGAAAGILFDNSAASNPCGAAAGSLFDDSAQPDPFGAAAGTPFDNNAESNPFGAAAGSPFDNGVELNPFETAGTPFDNSAESNPFGAAAGSPFDNGVELNPFEAAADSPFENNAETNPFEATAGTLFDEIGSTSAPCAADVSPSQTDATRRESGAGASASGVDARVSFENGLIVEEQYPAVLHLHQQRSSTSEPSIHGSSPTDSRTSSLDHTRAESAGALHENWHGQLTASSMAVGMVPFYSFLGSSSVMQGQSPLPNTSEHFASKYPVIAAAGTSIVPVEYRYDVPPPQNQDQPPHSSWGGQPLGASGIHAQTSPPLGLSDCVGDNRDNHHNHHNQDDQDDHANQVVHIHRHSAPLPDGVSACGVDLSTADFLELPAEGPPPSGPVHQKSSSFSSTPKFKPTYGRHIPSVSHHPSVPPVSPRLTAGSKLKVPDWLTIASGKFVSTTSSKQAGVGEQPSQLPVHRYSGSGLPRSTSSGLLGTSSRILTSVSGSRSAAAGLTGCTHTHTHLTAPTPTHTHTPTLSATGSPAGLHIASSFASAIPARGQTAEVHQHLHSHLPTVLDADGLVGQGNGSSIGASPKKSSPQ